MGDFGMDYQGGDGYSGGGYGGASQDPPSSTGRQRRAYDEQTVIPVTIRMVLRSQQDVAGGDGSLELEDGRKLALVRFVGAVRSCEENSTNNVYTVEDGTGLIEVKQWVNDNSECSALQELRQQTLKEHIYVKVVGQIKDYEGNKIIVANSVRPVGTGNELTHHMLEVVYSAEGHKRADSIVGSPPISSGIGFGGQQVAAASSSGTDDPLQKAIVHLFQHSGDAGNGVHVQSIVDELKSTFSEADIRGAIESLAEEGHIYSTVSDSHFQYAH
mmetsp:Transcript_23611/g.67691  ORF Transcript_23611/g.67691 Transcript_23611/m.67691 type:complete len:272 (+) Transcript_23611:166-981(+)